MRVLKMFNNMQILYAKTTKQLVQIRYYYFTFQVYDGNGSAIVTTEAITNFPMENKLYNTYLPLY